jgi:hypothetical protein
MQRAARANQRPHSRAGSARRATGVGNARIHACGCGCLVASARQPVWPAHGARRCGLVLVEPRVGEPSGSIHGRDRVRSSAGRSLPARVPRLPERSGGGIVRASAPGGGIFHGICSSARRDDSRRVRTGQLARAGVPAGCPDLAAEGAARCAQRLVRRRDRRSRSAEAKRGQAEAALACAARRFVRAGARDRSGPPAAANEPRSRRPPLPPGDRCSSPA